MDSRLTIADVGIEAVRAAMTSTTRRQRTAGGDRARFEGRHVVDLVACSFPTRAMRTRKGIATVLGLDEVAMPAPA